MFFVTNFTKKTSGAQAGVAVSSSQASLLTPHNVPLLGWGMPPVWTYDTL